MDSRAMSEESEKPKRRGRKRKKRGGPRRGAGRPKGSKDRYRRGLPRKVDRAFMRKLYRGEVVEPTTGGMMPLEYMLAVMRSPKVNRQRRDKMARDAAPYLHARLASTEIKPGGGGKMLPIKVEVKFVETKQKTS
jgi:hypothetical protein